MTLVYRVAHTLFRRFSAFLSNLSISFINLCLKLFSHIILLRVTLWLPISVLLSSSNDRQSEIEQVYCLLHYCLPTLPSLEHKLDIFFFTFGVIIVNSQLLYVVVYINI